MTLKTREIFKLLIKNIPPILNELIAIHDYYAATLLRNILSYDVCVFEIFNEELKGKDKHDFKDSKSWIELGEECINYIWECLHTVFWQDTNLVYKKAYSIAAISTALFYHFDEICSHVTILRLLDLAIMLGSNAFIGATRTVIDYIRDSSLESCNVILIGQKNPEYFTKKRLQFAILVQKNVERVPKLKSPNFISFYQNYFLPNIPVLLIDCINDWPAFSNETRTWKNLNNIVRTAGDRTVPIEMGDSYLTDNSGSRLMNIRDFVNDYIVKPQLKPEHSMVDDDQTQILVGYLAQYELFDHIPELKDDIIIPDFCALLHEEDETIHDDNQPTNPDPRDVHINAWFGPIGTVSPLHYDCYHNILAQVAGFKYVRLYEPLESQRLYPKTGIMSNNSQVDLLNIDHERFPLVKDARYVECILSPGDMLFIPRWHWHFVMSIDEEAFQMWNSMALLSIDTDNMDRTAAKKVKLSHQQHLELDKNGPEFSFSVSFWWGKRILKAS